MLKKHEILFLQFFFAKINSRLFHGHDSQSNVFNWESNTLQHTISFKAYLANQYTLLLIQQEKNNSSPYRLEFIRHQLPDAW